MLEAEVGRRAPSVNSMRILGARGLLDSPVTVETLNVSWSTHSRTGRIVEADRNTHFQSSTSAVLLEGRRRNWSSDANMDSSSIRTTVVRFEVTRMCFSSVGRKPARVTRTV